MTIMVNLLANHPLLFDNSILEEVKSCFRTFSYLPSSAITIGVIGDERPPQSIQELMLIFKGIVVMDEPSTHYLANLLTEHLQIHDSRFRVHSVGSRPEETQTIVFHTERFRPETSRHANTLKRLEVDDDEIPEHMRCAISMEMMDLPVYDIRSKDVKYDQPQLLYWVYQQPIQRMPHTNLPYDEIFMRVDYELMNETNQFVAEREAVAHERRLLGCLAMYHSEITEEALRQKMINKALRRAALAGSIADIKVLLGGQADINAQDENPAKEFTALHIALRQQNYSLAAVLISLGASIRIADAGGETALQLIQGLPEISRYYLMTAAKDAGAVPRESVRPMTLQYQMLSSRQEPEAGPATPPAPERVDSPSP